MSIAIVAIPKEDDYVWRISSEKVPHMTMLFLGDSIPGDRLLRIQNYLEHVVETTMYRFGADVESRGTLGPDNADVVFFNKEFLKMPIQAREAMLRNPDILAAYNASDQFPEWTPHLTLGYPTAPAKTDPRDYPGINWVEFDKIALWTGDYTGPEFQLGSRKEVAIEMSDYARDILAHHGVKGMKWGVRRAEKRWNKEITNVNTKSRMTLAFHNETVSRINRAVDDLNRSDKYRDVDLDTFKGKIKQDYEKDAHEAIMRALEDSVRSHYGTSPSGTQKAVYNRKTDQIDIRHVPHQVEHASTSNESPPDLTIQLKRNNVGLITSVEIVPLQQSDLSAEIVDSVLAHHGVKGMKWGVRKDRGHEGEQEIEAPKASHSSDDFIERVLAHASKPTVSTTPWSDFKESDYTIEQWRAACLIGPAESSDSKSDYKLPVKEPNGTLNKNGMSAAAGALAGARGGISATPEQKAAAKKKLVSYYERIGETPPESLTHSAEPLDILQHYGVKGMKWGVRRDGSTSSTTTRTSRIARPATDVTARQKPGQFVRTSGGKRQVASEDAIRVAASRQVAKKSTTDALTNKQLQDAVTRMNLEQQYHALVKKQDRRTRGQRFLQALFATGKKPNENSATAETAKQVAAALAKKAAASAAGA